MCSLSYQYCSENFEWHSWVPFLCKGCIWAMKSTKAKISKRSWSCSRAAARLYVYLTQLSAMCAKLKFSSDRTSNFKSVLFGQRLHYLWKSSQQKSNNNNISFICMTICRVTICTNDNTLQWLEWSIKFQQMWIYRKILWIHQKQECSCWSYCTRFCSLPYQYCIK